MSDMKADWVTGGIQSQEAVCRTWFPTNCETTSVDCSLFKKTVAIFWDTSF